MDVCDCKIEIWQEVEVETVCDQVSVHSETVYMTMTRKRIFSHAFRLLVRVTVLALIWK